MTSITEAPCHLGFNPSANDVYDVRAILRIKLSPELVLIILSLAKYHPRAIAHRSNRKTYHADDFDDLIVAGMYLTSPPVPVPNKGQGENYKIRYITFKMTSADQGWATWGGEGTYNNSHTWFEASVLKPCGRNPKELDVFSMPQFRRPSEARDYLLGKGWDFRDGDDGEVVWKVHKNITARDELTDYGVEWVKGKETILRVEEGKGIGMGGGQGFLDRLEPGDRVALWARAEQAAWKHVVAEATIEIGYDV